MRGLQVVSTAATLWALLGGVDAFWRMGCSVVQTGRIDTLVNPGALSAHAHTIVGGSNIGVNATYESLFNSRCTSCEIEADRSAYWSPNLYYAHANGTFEEVPHGGSVIYYEGRGAGDANIIPFPPGFMMLSGNKAARSYDGTTMTWGNATYPPRPIADRVSFVCLPDGPEPPQTTGFPTNISSCVNGLRAQMQFQSCWNGKELYNSANTHVDYLSQIDNGACSPDYPIQLVHLFMETLYVVSSIDTSGGGTFTFSQGDATGFGLHADFQNGWNMAVQTEAVQTCSVPDNFGQISFCPVLEASDTDGYATNCPEQPPQIGEPVHGLIDKLPGCITLTYGPEDAPAGSMECAAGVRQPTITKTADSTPVATASVAVGASFGLPDQQYLGCYNDSLSAGIRALNAFGYTNFTVMSVEFCQALCMRYGYRLSGVEYAQECHCDNAINPTSINGQNGCTWYCGGTESGNTTEICGGAGYINIYNNTNASFVPTTDTSGSSINAQPYQPLGPYPSNYLGCATDSTGSRTLTGNYSSEVLMTVELCASICGYGNGYQYYGIEYGTQCYCGNQLNPPGYLLNATSTPSSNTSSCTTRCGGNGAEMCGGSDALSLYYNNKHVQPSIKNNAGKYVTKGCLTDPNISGRSLAGTFTTSTKMTVEICVKYCLGHEYHYAGIEYGTECYCGNSIAYANGNAANPVTQQSCDVGSLTLCPGNSLEYCGAPRVMNLYVSATL